jgi:cyclophilin family peptidyl-prolyl cis-trans isomerase
MTGFKIITKNKEEIHFKFYLDEAPVTCKAFQEILPFARVFYHARVSGLEIWIDNVPPLDIIQENASVFTEPGEVVIGPSKPTRVKTANCFGIYYGKGKGLDAANIFARVIDADMKKLEKLGDSIWKDGPQELRIEALKE